MSHKYYSYSGQVIYNNNKKSSNEEEVVLNNDDGHIIRKKDNKIIEKKKINIRDFQKYLKKRDISISSSVLKNALAILNRALLSSTRQLDYLVDPNDEYEYEPDIEYVDEDQMPIFTDKIAKLIYKEKGLEKKDRIFLNVNLKVKELRNFINLRYAPDPIRYDKMTKKQLVDELKYPRYDSDDEFEQIGQMGGYNDLVEPQVGFEGNINSLPQRTLDFSFPDIIKKNI
jgi:hypothetical protein